MGAWGCRWCFLGDPALQPHLPHATRWEFCQNGEDAKTAMVIGTWWFRGSYKFINKEVDPLAIVYNELWKMGIELATLPINSMVIFNSYVSLPKGRCRWAMVRQLRTTWDNAGSMQPPVPAMCKMRISQLCINVHHHLSATAPLGPRNHPNIPWPTNINSWILKIRIEYTSGQIRIFR